MDILSSCQHNLPGPGRERTPALGTWHCWEACWDPYLQHFTLSCEHIPEPLHACPAGTRVKDLKEPGAGPLSTGPCRRDCTQHRPRLEAWSPSPVPSRPHLLAETQGHCLFLHRPEVESRPPGASGREISHMRTHAQRSWRCLSALADETTRVREHLRLPPHPHKGRCKSRLASLH